MIQRFLGGFSAEWLWALLAVVFLLWLLVALALVRLIRRSPPEREDPLEELKGRYARGEMGREEFEARKREIEKGKGGEPG